MKKIRIAPGFRGSSIATKLTRAMKLTAILIIFALMQVSAETYSQAKKFSLNLKNAPLSVLFDEIEKASGFHFFYDNEWNDLDRKVSVTTRDSGIEEVLDKMFRNTDISYEIFDRYIIIKNKQREGAGKQLTARFQRTVSGRVADLSNEALPGVTVMLKGTARGTMTDINGAYSIDNVPEDATLIFSFVGMRTEEVAVRNQAIIEVVMEEETIGMEDVVVVGYGVQKKENLTAAVDVVDMRNLENRPVVSATEMLQGSAPNLNITTSSSAPGKTSEINIRGFTSRNSTGNPLIIVDGVPQDIEFVNPNDIKSISVLKDAAASAIYGSRAPNGVLIITTKMGTKNTKMRFHYSGTARMSAPLNMPKALNAYDFVLLNNESGYNSQRSPEYPDETIRRIRDFIDGKLTGNNIVVNGKWGGPFDANANEDYIDNTYRDVVMNQSHNFSMDGGNDKTTYYAGVGYIRDQGIYESDIDYHQRKYLTLKIESDINDWLRLGLNTKYVRQETTRPNIRTGSDNDNNLIMSMIFRPNIPNVNRATIDGVEYSGYNEFSISPSLNGDGGKVGRAEDNLMTTLHGELTPVAGLKIRGSYTWNIDNRNDFVTEFIYKALQPDGTYLNSRRSVNQERYRKWKHNNKYSNTDLTVTYNKFFGKSDLTAMVGFQQELNKYDLLSASNTDFYTTSVPSFSTTYGANQLIEDQLFSWATRGYFGRVSYNYDGRYLFDFNGRYDASSRYSRETRWSFFPSVSTGYNIARENFWPLKDQVSMLKIKASWGSLGAAGTGRPLYLAPLGTGAQIGYVLGGERPPYVFMPGIVSADLTWTKPQTLGFGAEITALRDRLLLEYNWYQRTVRDETGVAEQLPEVLGTAPPVKNNAVSETRGWEITAEWRDKVLNLGGHALNYGVKLMLSDYIGYVVEYVDNTTGTRSGWTPGEQFGVVYGYESAGIQTAAGDLQNKALPGNDWYYPGDLFFRDRDGDGRIGSGDGNYWYSEGDRVKLGYSYPRYNYSITLHAGWKNLSMFILLDGVGQEVQYINNKITTGVTTIGSRGMLDFQGDLGYWNMHNPNAFFPRIYTSTKNFGTANDQYLLNLAHLRIKNINLGYRIPLKKNIVNSLNVNFSVENAGMIFYKSWDKLDPQFLKSPTYPPSRIFSVGLKCSL